MPLILIQHGRSSYAISIRPTASEPEQFAAEELGRYLEKIGGCRIPIQTNTRGRRLIVLDANLKAKSSDTFSIRTVGSKLMLTGASPRAVLFAVYTFLEECLGCGWLKPNDEHVPNLDSVTIGRLNIRQQPSFRDRILVHFPYHRARTVEQIDWMAKRKLNVSFVAPNGNLALLDRYDARNRLMPELRKRGLELRGPGHAFFAWLPPDRYFKKHPEYFSLIDGKRSSDTSLCVSNPAVAREVARNIGRFADTYPEFTIISLWHNDLSAWCQCEPCRAMLDPKERTMSVGNAQSQNRSTTRPSVGKSTTAAEMAFVNRVAGYLERSYPQLKLETLAYGSNLNPSRRVKPRRNVYCGLAVFDKCLAPENVVLPITKGPNRPNSIDILGWRAQTREFYVYEYYGIFHDFTPLFDVMGTDFRWYHHIGADGISSEIGVWNELHLYAFSKLAWNHRLTEDELLRAYCDAAYGPVSREMLQHWALLLKAKLDWNWNAGKVKMARVGGIPPRQWFEARRRQPKWKRCEAVCREILTNTCERLQRSALYSKSLALHTDNKVLARIRSVLARWSEMPAAWWNTGK